MILLEGLEDRTQLSAWYVSPTGSAFVNNLFAGTVMIGQGASDASNLMNGPDSMFVNAAAHDYRLRRHSPAIDAGQIVPPFTDGYRGTAPDLGAYEFRARPFAAGAGATRTRRP